MEPTRKRVAPKPIHKPNPKRLKAKNRLHLATRAPGARRALDLPALAIPLWSLRRLKTRNRLHLATRAPGARRALVLLAPAIPLWSLRRLKAKSSPTIKLELTLIIIHSPRLD